MKAVHYLYRTTRSFIKDIYSNRFVIWQLTKRDFINRYIGSYLGFIWSIIQPVVMIFVLWLVFTKAFKVGPINGNTPFIAWLTAGLIPWYFFSEALSSGTNTFQEYAYLVKKIRFQIAILPIVKVFSAFLTHLIFLVITATILLSSGVKFSLFWFQTFYYTLMMAVLLLGLTWIASSLQIFIKDTVQIINVILQFGFWLTPIIWHFDVVPEHYRIFFGLNPMFYIVKGYRDSLLFRKPFWELSSIDYYFAGIALGILFAGILIFKKLRPHFADVL